MPTIKFSEEDFISPDERRRRRVESAMGKIDAMGVLSPEESEALDSLVGPFIDGEEN